jgi:5-methyltetrahydrofolate--homocysteine methyltransferase
MALADFIAPQESFAPDYIGAFAVTVTLGPDAGGQSNEEVDADPQERFIAALAAALARVFALRVHEDLRRDWGQRSPALGAPHTRDFPGLCVRFGEPAAPDLTENAALLRLLHGAELGLSLDGAGGIQPHSSVCGLCFSHPQAVAFELGPVGEDQLEDYAARKEISRGEAAEILSAVRTPDV